MFIDEIIRQGDFIGIHWRYDLDDWMSINCKVKIFKNNQTKKISRMEFKVLWVKNAHKSTALELIQQFLLEELLKLFNILEKKVLHGKRNFQTSNLPKK